MKIDKFITDLRTNNNIIISVTGDQLDITAERQALTPDIIQEIKDKKEEILAFFKKVKDDNNTIPIVSKKEYYELSHAQRRLWVLDQLVETKGIYNVPLIHTFKELDIDAFKKSIIALIERHEVLRTTIQMVQGKPVQVVESIAEFKFEIIHNKKSNEELNTFIREETFFPFDLTSSAVRASIIEKTDGSVVFIFILHHIVTDGWSSKVLQHDLKLFYDHYANKALLELQPLRIQYKDYSHWQNGQLKLGKFDVSRKYWRDKLSGEIPILDLPLDRKRGKVKSYEGASVSYTIPTSQVEDLIELGNEHGTTLFMALVTMLNTLFYHYTNQTDIIFGTPVTGRDHPELEDQVGYYSNTIVFRSTFKATDTFIKLLENVGKVMIGGYEHQYYPFDLLVDELNLDRDINRNPLFDVMVSYNDITDHSVSQKQRNESSQKITSLEEDVNKFDLSFSFIKNNLGALVVDINYDKSIFLKAKILRMVKHIEVLLTDILKTPNRKLNEITLLSKREQLEILDIFNDTSKNYDLVEKYKVEINNIISSFKEPVANLKLYIIDSNNQLLPKGIPGEIAIGGMGSVKEYLNQDGLITEKFISNPYWLENSQEIYKTGDIGYWNEEGKVKLLEGRNTQKRIYESDEGLSKIENVLIEHSRIKNAAVIIEKDEQGVDHLVAYYVKNEEELKNKEIENKNIDSREKRYITSEPSFPNVIYRVDELFDQAVQNYKHNIAIKIEEREVTYKELQSKVDKLATYLKVGCGVRKGSTIGIMTGRSEKMIVAMLAILKVGAVFVPIDAEYPEDRISYMVHDAAIQWLIVDESIVLPKISEKVTTIFYESIEEELIYDLWDKEQTISLSDLCYICYTSGSTGTPKGVMVEHQSVSDYVQTFRKYFDIKDTDVVIQQSSISFDTSVEEIFPTLCAGGTLVIIPKGGSDIDGIIQAINEKEVTLLSTTPLVINELNLRYEELNRFPKTMISGGDALQLSYISKLINHTNFYNTYGPTEATVCATFGLVHTSASNIGSPIVNHAVYIVDNNEQLLPVGSIGEIYLAGPGIARGYINKETETRKRFISNPFGEGRCYKTGDLARWTKDGTLEFCGRKDNQVKIRGYRVEPNEVNISIAKLEAIKQCITVVKKDTEHKNHLVTYYISEKELSGDTIRNFIKEKLPHYMIPRYYTNIKEFPKTINGKIDVKALPRPEILSQDISFDLELKNLLKEKVADYMIPTYYRNLERLPITTTGEVDRKELQRRARRYLQKRIKITPVNTTEKKLLDIWEKYLKFSGISTDDNFFEIGGDSLKAMQIVSAIYKEIGGEITLRDIFSAPTIKELSELILGEQKEKTLLLKLNNEVEGLPKIFFIPPILGSSTIFKSLAMKMDKEYNAYGFQYKGFDTEETFDTSIKAIAKTFIAELKAMNIKESISLVGYSMGVPIAFEMAKTLEKEHDQIHLVFIDRGVYNQKVSKSNMLQIDKLLEKELSFWLSTALNNSERIKRLMKHNLNLLDNYKVKGKIKSRILTIEATRNAVSASMQDWKKHTRNDIVHTFIEASHYEILNKENENVVLEILSKEPYFQVKEEWL